MAEKLTKIIALYCLIVTLLLGLYYIISYLDGGIKPLISLITFSFIAFTIMVLGWIITVLILLLTLLGRAKS
jgi:uncharacterized membrane protein